MILENIKAGTPEDQEFARKHLREVRSMYTVRGVFGANGSTRITLHEHPETPLAFSMFKKDA